jgi:hypothetical protein
MNYQIGDTATVWVDGCTYTGIVYHVRENGWACVKTDAGIVASGPAPTILPNDKIARAILSRKADR